MSKDYIYIAEREWFESCQLADPVIFSDWKLYELYPQFFKVNYDLKLLVADVPTEIERNFGAYNDYRDKYGSSHIEILRDTAQNSLSKNIFLNNFHQEHFDYIVPFIKDTAEILYLFKCRWIKNLSVLSDFKKLRCVLIYGNTSLETLWNMRGNKELKVLSLDYVTKIRNVDSLTESGIEYFALNSEDNNGNKKELLINDLSVFDKMTDLKHLKLVSKKVNVDY